MSGSQVSFGQGQGQGQGQGRARARARARVRGRGKGKGKGKGKGRGRAGQGWGWGPYLGGTGAGMGSGSGFLSGYGFIPRSAYATPLELGFKPWTLDFSAISGGRGVSHRRALQPLPIRMRFRSRR